MKTITKQKKRLIPIMLLYIFTLMGITACGSNQNPPVPDLEDYQIQSPPVPNLEDCQIQSPSMQILSLENKHITQIVASGRHAMIVTEDGQLYTGYSTAAKKTASRRYSTCTAMTNTP